MPGCSEKLRTLRLTVTPVNSNRTDESTSCSSSFSAVIGFSTNINTLLSWRHAHRRWNIICSLLLVLNMTLVHNYDTPIKTAVWHTFESTLHSILRDICLDVLDVFYMFFRCVYFLTFTVYFICVFILLPSGVINDWLNKLILISSYSPMPEPLPYTSP